ncbi:hypothetical protein KIPB_007171 [Kipferlia bialata]|uniref:Uncharacterized protein n=1 Tax=Kipferlia bialata TaxID=797122 RepID=A0A9K3GKD2_9EUKA|nr:hypothetical protein KIPB_007171 [Kipferlia bialata]|eukprot:g7171.t1
MPGYRGGRGGGRVKGRDQRRKVVDRGIVASDLCEEERITLMCAYTVYCTIRSQTTPAELLTAAGIKKGSASRDLMYDMLNADRKRGAREKGLTQVGALVSALIAHGVLKEEDGILAKQTFHQCMGSMASVRRVQKSTILLCALGRLHGHSTVGHLFALPPSAPLAHPPVMAFTPHPFPMPPVPLVLRYIL